MCSVLNVTAELSRLALGSAYNSDHIGMLSKTVQNVIDRLAKLPGIGPRHASRIVFYLLKTEKKDVNGLAEDLKALKERVCTCPVCFSSYEETNSGNTCAICADTKRKKTLLCVIEKESDIEPIEKTGFFKGVYHVVGEDVDTLEKTPPPAVARLKERILYIRKQLPLKRQEEMEVILATNATTEGDALAAYLETVKGFARKNGYTETTA